MGSITTGQFVGATALGVADNMAEGDATWWAEYRGRLEKLADAAGN